jgi:diguanylate cyclase (GGDEF)-like protein/PAS domain S-box-containing protein
VRVSTARPTGPGRSLAERRRLRALGVVGLALVLLSQLGDGPAGFALVVSALAAASIALLAARRLPGDDRVAWLLLGSGQVANAVGNVALAADLPRWITTVDLAPGIDWGTSALFTLATATTGAGIRSLCARAARPALRWWLLLDAAVVLAAVTTLAQASGLGARVGGGTDIRSLIALASVVAESATLLVGLALWRARPVGERAGPRLAVVGLGAAWVGDTGLTGHLPVPAGWLVASWVLSSVLLALGAALSTGTTGRLRSPVDLDRAVLVVSAVMLVCVPLTVLLSPRGITPVVLRVSGAAVVVVVVRLLFVTWGSRALARRLSTSERHFRSMVESSPDVLLRLGLDGRVRFVSHAAGSLLQSAPADLVGRRVGDLVSPVDRDCVLALLAAVRADPAGTHRGEVRVPWGDGVKHLEALGTMLDDELVLAVRDVTERVRLQVELADAAYRDALTGLPNRAALTLQLAERRDAAAGREGRADPDGAAGTQGGCDLGVLFVDIDGFKSVNDTSGHLTGDQLLSQAGRRVAGAVREGDVPGRFGGDEFVVVLRSGTTSAEAERVGRDVAATLGRPFEVAGRELLLGASVGVAFAEPDAEPDQLLRDADVALYRAKAAGRGRVVVFEPVMLDEVRRRVDLEQRLRVAVEQEQLSLVYQPVVDLTDGGIVGAEALLRWTEDGVAVLPAAELVALAERTGWIRRIGSWAMERAVAQAAGWSTAGYPVGVAVNLSVAQLADPDLVGSVDRMLREHGLPPDRLTLEITESVLLERTAESIVVLERLCGLGLHLSVDDFGTGYSALEYLRRLPVDQIKVDRAFVQGLGQQQDVAALLRSVVSLGRDLGLGVTVEGVESAHQVRLLRALHAHRGQGFAFSRPLDEASMLESLARGPFVVTAPDDVVRLPRVADTGWAARGWAAAPPETTTA